MRQRHNAAAALYLVYVFLRWIVFYDGGLVLPGGAESMGGGEERARREVGLRVLLREALERGDGGGRVAAAAQRVGEAEERAGRVGGLRELGGDAAVALDRLVERLAALLRRRLREEPERLLAHRLVGEERARGLASGGPLPALEGAERGLVAGAGGEAGRDRGGVARDLEERGAGLLEARQVEERLGADVAQLRGGGGRRDGGRGERGVHRRDRVLGAAGAREGPRGGDAGVGDALVLGIAIEEGAEGVGRGALVAGRALGGAEQEERLRAEARRGGVLREVGEEGARPGGVERRALERAEAGEGEAAVGGHRALREVLHERLEAGDGVRVAAEAFERGGVVVER